MPRLSSYAIIFVTVFAMSCTPRQSSEKIRTGTLPETLADEEAFYSIRGGNDYSRAPLRYPLQLAKVSDSIDLHWKRDIVVENILSVGVFNGYAFGESGTYVAFKKENPGSWFTITVQEGKLDVFKDKAEMESRLKALGISSAQLLPAATVVDAFMKKGVRSFGP